jgi:hypothetical protein
MESPAALKQGAGNEGWQEMQGFSEFDIPDLEVRPAAASGANVVQRWDGTLALT